MDKQEAMAFGVTSAREAFDQVKSYTNLEDAIQSYRENVRDTLQEHSASDHEAKAFEVFDREVAILRSKLVVQTEWRLEYSKTVDCDVMKCHIATFDNLEDAQLWWDSIQYLRNDYFNNNLRPR